MGPRIREGDVKNPLPPGRRRTSELLDDDVVEDDRQQRLAQVETSPSFAPPIREAHDHKTEEHDADAKGDRVRIIFRVRCSLSVAVGLSAQASDSPPPLSQVEEIGVTGTRLNLQDGIAAASLVNMDEAKIEELGVASAGHARRCTARAQVRGPQLRGSSRAR